MEIQKSLDRDKEEIQLEHEYIYAGVLDQREKKEEARDKIVMRDDKKKKVSEKILILLWTTLSTDFLFPGQREAAQYELREVRF